MTILDIVEKHPQTEDIFSFYDDIVGKCVLCNCLFDRIDTFANDYNINLKTLTDKINKSI